MKNGNENALCRLAWFFDSHSHANIRINHDPDVRGMARVMKQCGIEEVTIHAKAHDGYAYYPSRVGYPHPRLKGDSFGDAARACARAGIRVMAYISFGIDGEAARHHPEWCQVRANGTDLNPDWFVSVCPFTGYTEALMLPQIAEVLELYPVSGLFFDTMGAFGICYCDVCRVAFQEAHALDIPREADDPNWGVYGRFRRTRALALLDRLGRFIRERRPDAKVGFNMVGSIYFPEPLPEGVTCITLDYPTNEAQSLHASCGAAFGSMADAPADVMSTIFNQGWGDWSPRPVAGLEQAVVPVWARGCLPVVGDRLHPANRLDPISVRAMRAVAAVRRRLEREYPAPGARLRPDVLLLHGARQMNGIDGRRFARDRSGLLPLMGGHRLLLDAGANFAVAPEYAVARRLETNPLVILPELAGLEPETDAALRAYVERGGRVLVVGAPPDVGGHRLDWLGATRSGSPWQDHIYLPPWPGGETGGPVLVRGDFHAVTPGDAEVVLPAIRPYDCDHGVRFGWGIGPASAEPSEYPALARRLLGEGEVWHLEAPVFSDYHQHGNWTQIAWFRGLLDRLVPAPVAQAVSESGSVEVVAHVAAQTTWVFLINHGGEQLSGERRWSRVLPPLPPYPVTLRVRDTAGRQPAAVTAGGKPLRWQLRDGAVQIRLRLATTWRIVRIDWIAGGDEQTKERER